MRLLVIASVTVVALGVVGAAQAAPGDSKPSSAPRSAGRPKPAVTQPVENELGDEEALVQVVSLYEAGKYNECAASMSQLLSGENPRRLRDADIVETARIYHAACLIGAGRSADADQPLKEAIRANMQMKPPDSLVFPPPVIERFLRVRQGLYEEIKRAEETRVQQAREAAEAEGARKRAEEARVRELERMAAEETVVVRNRRWIASVPFGVGQFQNGDDGLGWVFFTGETALAVTALTSIGMRSYLELEASRLNNEQNNSVLLTWTSLIKISSWGLLAAASAGVLQAHVAFVPETREQRKRQLPPSLLRPAARAPGVTLVPTLIATDREWRIGVGGMF